LSSNRNNNATEFLREQKRQTVRNFIKRQYNNKILHRRYYMNFREKIYVKKSRIRKAVERENTLKGGVVQRATKS